MTVLDIISVVNDETPINIWENGEIIATYDGKNSIPNELNNRTASQISGGHYLINIDL